MLESEHDLKILRVENNGIDKLTVQDALLSIILSLNAPSLSLYLPEYIPALSLHFIFRSLVPQTLVATLHFTPRRTGYKMAGTKPLKNLKILTQRAKNC